MVFKTTGLDEIPKRKDKQEHIGLLMRYDGICVILE